MASPIKKELDVYKRQLEVLSAPEGWTTNVHRANSYVAVTPPANATMGLGELRLQGTCLLYTSRCV